jgi:hypothetical protein
VLPIKVTFNDSTPYTPTKELDIINALSLRILFGVYCQPSNDKDEFTYHHDFVSTVMARFKPISLLFVIRTILEHHWKEKKIILYIDELYRVDPEVGKILTAVGEALNHYGQFACLVTTLDRLPLFDFKTTFGRPIFYISLTPLSLDRATELVKPETLIQRQIVAWCNGHPRSLEYTKSEFHNLKSIGFDLEFSDFITAIQKRDLVFDIENEIVFAALRGTPMAERDTFSSSKSNTTFRDAIKKGVCYNSFTSGIDGERQIPTLSPLQLFIWSSVSASPNLKAILAKLLQFPSAYIETGTGYEHFHAYWEVLYREVNDGKIPPYFHTSPGYNCKARKKIGVIRCNKHHWPTVQTAKDGTRWCSDLINRATNEPVRLEDYKDYVFWIGGNNPGGIDIVIFDEAENGGKCINLVIVTECRYSQLTSSKSLSLSEVTTKRNGTKKAFSSVMNLEPLSQFELEQQQIIQVFASYRVLENITAESIHSEGTLPTSVLDISLLNNLYTPTLCQLSYFYTLECPQEPVEKKESEPAHEYEKRREEQIREEQEKREARIAILRLITPTTLRTASILPTLEPPPKRRKNITSP